MLNYKVSSEPSVFILYLKKTCLPVSYQVLSPLPLASTWTASLFSWSPAINSTSHSCSSHSHLQHSPSTSSSPRSQHQPPSHPSSLSCIQWWSTTPTNNQAPAPYCHAHSKERHYGVCQRGVSEARGGAGTGGVWICPQGNIPLTRWTSGQGNCLFAYLSVCLLKRENLARQLVCQAAIAT